jgi:hypothetical protein
MDTEPRPQYVKKMNLPDNNNEQSKLDQVPKKEGSQLVTRPLVT